MNSNSGGEFLTTLLLLAAIAFGIYVVALVAFYYFLILCAFSTFIAFAWSFVCLLAWRRSFHLGKIFLHSEDAQAFIWRGVYGAIIVPAFLVFAEVFLGFRINWSYFYLYATGGYTLLSVGFEYIFAKRKSVPYVDHHYAPSTRQLSPPPEQNLILSPPRKPRFASWDDGEEFK